MLLCVLLKVLHNFFHLTSALPCSLESSPSTSSLYMCHLNGSSYNTAALYAIWPLIQRSSYLYLERDSCTCHVTTGLSVKFSSIISFWRFTNFRFCPLCSRAKYYWNSNLNSIMDTIQSGYYQCGYLFE